MRRWTLSWTLKTALVLFAAYFPIAFYLKYTYVPRPDPPPVTYLEGSFIRFGTGNAFIVANPIPMIDGIADSPEDPFKSTIVLLENGKPLGPPHSVHSEIVREGGRRYSHWRGLGIIFSTSDNSDPNSNWNIYSITR